MCKTFNFSILIIIALIIPFGAISQNVSINSTGVAPDASAMLDVASISSGILIPRMTTLQRTGIVSPANGLLVFDTDKEGFYFYDGSATTWRAILNNSKSTELAGWSTLGNTGTNDTVNFIGTTDSIDIVLKSNNSERLRIYKNNGIGIADLSFATSTGIDIGTLSGITANTGISIGAITGTGIANAITTGTLSNTGTTSTQLNLGTITGNNATSHIGIGVGNISGATANSFGINIGTLTGGTTANYGLNIGAITTTGATNSYGINIGALGGSGTNNYGLNIATINSTGTLSAGININGLSGTAATNAGVNIGTISNGSANNFGLNISGTADAATNFAIHSTAPAQSYIEGDVVIGKDAGDDGSANVETPIGSVKLDVRGTITGAMPLVAFSHMNDNTTGGDDDFIAIVAATRPSTNEVYLRVTTSSTVNDTELDNTANWDAWESWGSPTGSAGYPFIVGLSVSCVATDNSTDRNHAVISARMSNGDVWIRTASDRRSSALELGDPVNWEAWTNMGNPGM